MLVMAAAILLLIFFKVCPGAILAFFGSTILPDSYKTANTHTCYFQGCQNPSLPQGGEVSKFDLGVVKSFEAVFNYVFTDPNAHVVGARK